MARPKPVVRVLRPPPPEPSPEQVERFIHDGERPQASTDARERLEASADVRGRPQASTVTRRRPRSPKSIVTREGGRQLVRATVYLEPEVADALDDHLAAEGGEASRVIVLALRAWLRAQKGARS